MVDVIPSSFDMEMEEMESLLECIELWYTVQYSISNSV